MDSLAPQLLGDVSQTVNRRHHHRSRSYDEQTFSCVSASMLTGSGGRDDSDEVPQDISAFYGHPLTAATHSEDGEALALLHEYHSMQANDTALTRRFHGFHQLDDLESSSSPDVSTCYQTTVNDDDDDDEEHLVGPTGADNSADFSDFESGEERGIRVKVTQSGSCSRSDCIDTSPLQPGNTYLSDQHVPPPITNGLAAESDQEGSLSQQEIVFAAESDEDSMTHHNILLNDSDEEVDPAQFEHFDDDDDDDDDENQVVYTSVIPEDDDFDTSLDSDVIIDYRMSALNNWSSEYSDDNDDVRTATERFHGNFPTSTSSKSAFASMSTLTSSPRLADKSEYTSRLKVADQENRKRKSKDEEPQSLVKHAKREEQDLNGDTNLSEIDGNRKQQNELISEHLLSKTHGTQLIDNVRRQISTDPVTGKMANVTTCLSSTIQNFENKSVGERRMPAVNPVKIAGCCQHSVDRVIADSSMASRSVAVTLSSMRAPYTVVSNCHPMTATVNGQTQINSPRYTTPVCSSTCDRHCGSCLISTLSSATANLVSQTALMGSTAPLALRHSAALNRPCSADQLVCCGGSAVRLEVPISSWSGVFPRASAPTASSPMHSMQPLSHIQSQYRPSRPHLGLPPASKQWPTATVVPITSMTSSPSSNQPGHAPKVKQRKKAVARMSTAELTFGRDIAETNWQPPMRPHGPSHRPVIVGSPLPSRPEIHYRPLVGQPVANVVPDRDSNRMNQLPRTSHPLLSSNFQPHQLTAPGGRVVFDSSKTTVLPTIDAAQHSQQVHLQQQQQQQLLQRHQLNGDCRTHYRYEQPMNGQSPGAPSHTFRQTSAVDTLSVPDSSSMTSGNTSNTRGMLTGEGGGARANNMPKLPFPLPPVPPGYRLVITHHSLPSNDTQTTTAPQVTQLIIDNPAAEAMAAGNCSSSGQSKVATSTAETGVCGHTHVNGEDGKLGGDLSTVSMNNSSTKTPPVRPSTLSLNQSATRTQQLDTPQRTRSACLTDQLQVAKFELESPTPTMEMKLAPNCANYFQEVERCRPHARNINTAAKYLKAGSSTTCCDSSGNDDILERSMKAAKVWDEYTYQLTDRQKQQQQLPSNTPQHRFPEHVIKVEQSRSLPSTPTGPTASQPGGPQGQICSSSALGRRLPLTPDGSSTPLASQSRANAFAMMMTSPNGTTPEGMTSLQQRHSDDSFVINQRYIDQNNNFNVNCSGMNAPYELRSVGSLEMAHLQQQMIITPSSDDTTSPEDFLQIADHEGKLTDRDNWQKTQSTGTASSKFDTISSFTRRSHISVIPKIDPDLSGYQFYLEASISTNKRVDEDRLTYLNKGQYYGLVLTYTPPVDATNTPRKHHIVRSVVMVLFRERHSQEEEQKAWEFWHSRQHSFKQRVIDVDSKICGGAVPISIEEIAYNAVAIVWNTQDQCVKVNIAVNCLSTDFSHQKGIKGSPLHLQVDTFEDECSDYLMHRTYAQIKVFCDKGADRKTREEERKIMKLSLQGELHEKHQQPCERTYFYTMADLSTPPILFQPQNLISKVVAPESGSAILPSATLRTNSRSYDTPISTPRRMFENNQQPQRVLLYVREEDDHVFTALMLEYPTVECLLMAIEEKYNVDCKMIKNVFTRSKKCMLVRVDDNFVRHFANESTYIIRINRTAVSQNDKNDTDMNSDVTYDVTLVEIDVQNDGNNV